MTSKGSIALDHLSFDEHFDEPADYEPGHDFDVGDDCGRWRNGKLTFHCTMAGTEFCDWECPYSRREQ
ncbi:hypothetical protein EDF68_101981 [Ochrobactrum sp. BH3]|nr:hypothetical protein EDF68_101981 [Ochrobactrum sp. BH3]